MKHVESNFFSNMLYLVIAICLIYVTIDSAIKSQQKRKQEIEMHKLNIEKTSLEIEILKQKQ